MSLSNGIGITGSIVPKYDTDKYHTHEALNGLGGCKQFADKTARNAFVLAYPDRLQKSELAVLDDGTLWRLNTTIPAGADTDWTAVVTGGGGGGTATVAPLATWLLGVYSSLMVITQVGLPRILVADGTFAGWQLFGLTGPVGADAIFDIKKSTDGGTTWTSLWASTPGNRPRITDGQTVGSGTSFDAAGYAAGNLLLPDIVQVGSVTPGMNITLAIF